MHPLAHKGNKGALPFQYLCAGLATVIRRSAFWRDKREIGVEPRTFRLRPLYLGTGAFCFMEKSFERIFSGKRMWWSFHFFIPAIFYLHFIPFTFLFPSAHAAGAPPFSAVRERRQRERKGGNHVSPLWTPYKAAAAGLLRKPESMPANWAASARSNNRHTARFPLPQFVPVRSKNKRLKIRYTCQSKKLNCIVSFSSMVWRYWKICLLSCKIPFFSHISWNNFINSAFRGLFRIYWFPYNRI